MSQHFHFRTVLAPAIVFLLTCAVLSYAQRGGGGTSSGGGGQRGGTSQSGGAPRSGGTQTPRSTGAPPRGAPPRGQREDQPQELDLDPTHGMVLAYVSVTDKDHKSIVGLKKENFSVTEDNVPQHIELFDVDSAPVSVGFVLGGPPNESKGVPEAFLKATPWTTNEFFLINDNHHPPGGTVIQSFTTDIMKATVLYPQGGVTADSIYLGLDYLREAANKRKILILVGGTLSGDDISPGSGLSPDYVERQATKQDVVVYSILTSNDDSGTIDDGGTSAISPLTGGREYLATPLSYSLEAAAKEIALGLGVQYHIGYHSTNDASDGKWRKIRVSLVNPPESAGKLSIWTKAGYYKDKAKKTK